MSLQVVETATLARAAPRREPARIRPAAIRAYDIRGLAGRDIDPTGAYALGLSYAAAAREAGLSRIGVGRDGRLSSPSLEQALVWGMMDGGLRIERIGLATTPMLAYAARALGLDGAVMVTASHNPAAANGFKISLGEGRVHGAALQALVAGPCIPGACGSARRVSVLTGYVDDLARAADGMDPLRVVWDCGHGATGPAVERLVGRLPGEHTVINGAVDGRFPAHHPDPAEAANLSQLAEAVTQRRADLGVAFDGDGDRIGVVDAGGRILWADQLLLLLARDLLERRPGAVVVADAKCSTALFDGVAQAGGRAVMSPSGHVHVQTAMRREDAALGGEFSGHIFCGDGWGDDALYAAIRLFQAVSRHPGGLSAFREGLAPSFATPELRIGCADDRRAAVVAEVAGRLGEAFDPTLGLRVRRPEGWWLLRASGTEPVLSARCEAAHPEGLDALRAELRRELALSGVAARV